MYEQRLPSQVTHQPACTTRLVVGGAHNLQHQVNFQSARLHVRHLQCNVFLYLNSIPQSRTIH